MARQRRLERSGPIGGVREDALVMRGLLLLGTDTGVGKTTVGCGLLELARRRGLRLVPYKPVETGCAPSPADTQRLLAAAFPSAPDSPGLSLTDICSYAFGPPVAPSVAARVANNPISAAVLRHQASVLAERGDALLVEAAVCVLTPYGPDLTAASLAALLELDVLLVAANRLGTINHTALAVGEIRRRRLTLQGIILVNVGPEPRPDQAHNATEIAALTGLEPLGTLAYVPSPGPGAIADRIAADVDLRPLLGGWLASE